MSSTPDWLRKAISEGLQALFVLRLKGAPSHDTAKAVASAWTTVIASRPIAWDEQRDRPRIRQAFVTLAATCEYWPAPVTFLQVLPPNEPLGVKQLPKPSSNDIPPVARAFIDSFLKKSKA